MSNDMAIVELANRIAELEQRIDDLEHRLKDTEDLNSDRYHTFGVRMSALTGEVQRIDEVSERADAMARKSYDKWHELSRQIDSDWGTRRIR